MIEYWSAGRREAYLYTQDPMIAKELMKEFQNPARYYHGASPFGWQFLVPSRIVPVLNRRFKSPTLLRNQLPEACETENSPFENQRLTTRLSRDLDRSEAHLDSD